MNDIDKNKLIDAAANLSEKASSLSNNAAELTEQIINTPTTVETIVHSGINPFIFATTIFVLACFVGYYVVWKVTPALHTPLMSVTNAVSSIIVIGAILAVGVSEVDKSSKLGAIAIFIASINIFGGFIVTQRMLQMFKKKG